MSSFIVSRFAFRSASANTRATTSKLGGTGRSMSTMHDNDPETLETEKRRNLSNQQHKTSTPHAHAPGWNEHLASTSEADIKADKSTLSTTDELQSATLEYVRARYAPDDRMGPTTAYYSKDEVSGPLGSAQGKEEKILEVVHEEINVIKDGQKGKRR